MAFDPQIRESFGFFNAYQLFVAKNQEMRRPIACAV